VNDLWEVRDFWEWLAPGYTNTKTREYALSHAAFVSFGSLRKYRDFKMELEGDSTPENPKVGLWAKAYMSSKTFEYLGTLLSRQSVDAVTSGRLLEAQDREVSEQKTKRETETKKDLLAVARGKYRDHFSASRLADAIAVCDRNWGHFNNGLGKLTEQQQWTPIQLARDMRAKGLRAQSRTSKSNTVSTTESSESSKSSKSSLSTVASSSSSAESLSPVAIEQQRAGELADLLPTSLPPPLKRHAHSCADDLYGFKKGERVQTASVASARRVPDDLFQKQVVVPGCFVITRPAESSHWAKASSKLSRSPFWVWRVVNLHEPGTVPPGYQKACAEYIYEAELFKPVSANTGPWTQVWDVVGPQYMRTKREKVGHRLRKKARQRKRDLKKAKLDLERKRLRKRGVALERVKHVKIEPARPSQECVPVRSYLRPCNIVGGGFSRTSSGCIPSYVRQYWSTHSKR
jgi:hypothetical protein